jgi:hypothetical protein
LLLKFWDDLIGKARTNENANKYGVLRREDLALAFGRALARPDRPLICVPVFYPNLYVIPVRCQVSVRDFADLVDNPVQSVEVFKARAVFDSW